MEVRDPHAWPSSPEEAEAIQDRLRPMLELDVAGPARPRTVAGLDVAYAGDGGGTGTRLAAAVVVLDGTSLEVIEESVAVGTAGFPYVPGLFAFRELPALLNALRDLKLDTACRNVLDLASGYRLPETTRRADRLSREALTR